MNSVNIIGNITRDPEAKFTTSGKEISNISIAYNKTVRGNKETFYFDCTAFDKTANFINTYLKKGQQVGITGSLRQERWDDKTTGQKRYKISITIDRIKALGGKKEEEQHTDAQEPTQEHMPVEEGEIPFN